MKYIRTKEDVYEIINSIYDDERDYDGNYTGREILVGYKARKPHKKAYNFYFCSYNPFNEDIERAANTIEELCDFAYALWEDKTFEVYDLTYDYVKLEDLSKWLAKGDVLEVYYGVKTDKGLIYVAKMNEKGELELL